MAKYTQNQPGWPGVHKSLWVPLHLLAVVQTHGQLKVQVLSRSEEMFCLLAALHEVLPVH